MSLFVFFTVIYCFLRVLTFLSCPFIFDFRIVLSFIVCLVPDRVLLTASFVPLPVRSSVLIVCVNVISQCSSRSLFGACPSPCHRLSLSSFRVSPIALRVNPFTHIVLRSSSFSSLQCLLVLWYFYRVFLLWFL